MQLKNKVIIITGGYQGLGRAVVEYLAGKGTRLALVDLNRERPNEAITACKAIGGDARAYVCSVAGEERITHVVAQVTNDFGAINGLVNSAGILRDGLTTKVRDGQLSKMNLTQRQPVINVNLTGVFLCAHEMVAKVTKLKNEGTIVNISSIFCADDMGQANYSVVKAGVTTDTTVWARGLARYGIRVADVAPGFIGTEMTAGMKPEVLEEMTISIPLRRMDKPVEIAHSVAHIFEDGYYAGRVLELDSGLRL